MKVLVTGATGTFGHAFTRHVLAFAPGVLLRLMARHEVNLQRMAQRFVADSDRLTWILGDVRDRERVDLAMWGVDAVVHAAALKQVDMVQRNPLEAVKTNIGGSVNVLQAALDARVARCLYLSSDKAVEPVNLYGVTKAVGERLWTSAAEYTGGRGDQRFAALRYGNVLGSRGSVVSVWRRQMAEGRPVSVMPEPATRFLLTPMEAASLAWELLSKGTIVPGGVYVPYLPTAWLSSLADAVVPEGYPRAASEPSAVIEKAHETLVSIHEWPRATRWYAIGDPGAVQPRGFVLYPHPIAADMQFIGRVDTAYSSDSPRMSGWLGVAEIRHMIETIDEAGLLDI